jgi:UDP-GlcNAc:undecaprenyl-phosphate GlcNAc-1-phosphate transferase
VELVLAFGVALVASPILRRTALNLGVVDRRDRARIPVPSLGGVAVLLGLLVGVVASGRYELLIPYGAALVLGVVQDVRGLPAGARVGAGLLVAVLAALVVPGPALVKAGTGVVALVLVSTIGALEDQDGLAPGAGIVSAVAFAILGGDASEVGLALAGALVAFLVFNAPPARMYLGASGVLLVGVGLATLPALTEHGTSDWSVWIGVPLILGLPLVDAAVSIGHGTISRAPSPKTGRSHIHDQLHDQGWRPEASTAMCIVLQGGLAALGVLAAGVAVTWAVAILAVTVVGLFVLAATGGFLGRATA